MLSKIDHDIPLRIFFTSRPSRDLENLFSPLPVVVEQITVEDSLQDIRKYVQIYSKALPVDDDKTRQTLIEKIVEKSAGCFLWTSLVMYQLQDVYSLEETQSVLEEVPQEMEPLYTHNLEMMSKNVRAKRLAKSVLTWTVCATRALTLDELKEAIKFDINDIMSRDLERSIPSLCGQFVYVNKHHQVQIVHDTARAFLTGQDLESEFQIQTSSGHLRLALACLKYLNSEEMRFSRRHRSVVTKARESVRSAIADYACMSFSEHIARATSSSDVLFTELTQFLRTNILSWVEYICRGQDLGPLIRTAKHFKAYALRRAKYIPMLEDDVNLWAIDLPRIITEFGVNLRNFPAAIHDLVAPLCPRNSIIHRRFSNSLNGIRLKGLSYLDWYDRISCIYYRGTTAKSIACRDKWFAVGLSNGMIHIYYSSSCAEALSFNHGESVRILQFGTFTQLLASAGLRSVKLWDTTTGSPLWNIALSVEPLRLAFNNDDTILVAATRSEEVLKWSTLDASLASQQTWANLDLDGDTHSFSRTPSAVEISMDHNLMAIMYRGMPISLWCLENNRHLGYCTRTSGKHENAEHAIVSAVFNPDPDIWLLAVAYWDGDVALFDTLYGAMRRSVKSDMQILTVSPNGKILAGGNSNGRMQLYSFETLQLLYCITPSGDSVTALTFTSDNLRFLDLRGSQANVWEPSVLVHKDIDDNMSEPSDAARVREDEFDRNPLIEPVAITTLVCCYGDKFAICGKNNGQINVYDLVSPENPPQLLYQHKGSFTEVSLLDWAESEQILASVDNSNRVLAMRVTTSKSYAWSVKDTLLNCQPESDEPIKQILISPDGTRLMVSTYETDFLWSLENKNLIVSKQTSIRKSWVWFKHPSNQAEVILLCGSTIQFYRWADLEEVSNQTEIGLPSDGNWTFNPEHLALAEHDGGLMLKLIHDRGKATPSSSRKGVEAQLFSINLSGLDLVHSSTQPIPCVPMFSKNNSVKFDILVGIVTTILGGHLLIFISESGWVCSIDVDRPAPHDTFQQHFFIPFAWISTRATLIVKITERRDVIFVQGDEIVIVENGLDKFEIVKV
jgi:WD40 repeat protein